MPSQQSHTVLMAGSMLWPHQVFETEHKAECTEEAQEVLVMERTFVGLQARR